MSAREASEGRETGAGGWASIAERGTRNGLRLALWWFEHLGHRGSRVLLYPIVGYFWFFSRAVRRASRDYLERVQAARGGPTPRRAPGPRDSFHHVLAFADTILDRFWFWAGRYDDFEVVIHGREEAERAVAERGAVLLSAHLGSFDALRVIARDTGTPVNVVMFTANARRIIETYEALDPDSHTRVIEIDPTSIRSAFEIKACLDRKEIVAMLGDRVVPGIRQRVSHANFLGARAPFPQGPFLIPLLLGLPVILALALKRGPRRYDVYLETLAEGERVAPADREEVVRERVEAFASRLEHFCLRNPYQWFNFYDFWADPTRARN